MSKKGVRQRKEQSKDKFSSEAVRELITEKQQQLSDNRTPNKKLQKSLRTEVNLEQQMQDEEEANVSIEQIKVANTEKISVMISQLIAKNINAKNAFDVPLIQINETKDFNYQLTGDNSWKKLSSTLQSNNKIYGYRVDATHSHTYKVLQLLTRKEKQLKNGNEEEQANEKNDMGQTIAQFCEVEGEGVLSKYLQKNYKGINILHLQMFFNVNPILEKTKRIFDQQGLGGLLLNNVQMQGDLTLNLNYQFTSKQQHCLLSHDQNMVEENLFDSSELGGRNVFEAINQTCNIYNIIENNQEQILVKQEENQIKDIWRELQLLISPPIICPVDQSAFLQLKPINDALPVEETHIVNEQLVSTQKKQENDAKELEKSMLMGQNNQMVASQNCQPHSQTIQNEMPINNVTLIVPAQNQYVIAEQKDCQALPQPALTQVLPIIEITFPISKSCNLQNQSFHSDNHDLNLPISNQSFKTDSTVKSKEIPIASIIRINPKLNLTTTDILKEIDAKQDNHEAGEQLVQKWKNADKIPKKTRKPRVHKQQPQISIDFSTEQYSASKKKRKQIIKEDKQKKLQLKKYLKSVQSQINREKNIYFDTSRWNSNYSHSLLLLNETPRQIQVQPPAAQEVSNNTLNLSNLSNFVDLVIEDQDVKKMRTVSLREVKESVTNFIFKQKIRSFIDLYNSFVKSQGLISPALCFLTVLHLANEHNLGLVGENQADIKIMVEIAEVQQ